jgi:hypothetical protein
LPTTAYEPRTTSDWYRSNCAEASRVRSDEANRMARARGGRYTCIVYHDLAVDGRFRGGAPLGRLFLARGRRMLEEIEAAQEAIRRAGKSESDGSAAAEVGLERAVDFLRPMVEPQVRPLG